jgi:hypothetical protein
MICNWPFWGPTYKGPCSEDGEPANESLGTFLVTINYPEYHFSCDMITSETGGHNFFIPGDKALISYRSSQYGRSDRVQEFVCHSRSNMTKKYAKMNSEGLKSVLREKRERTG